VASLTVQCKNLTIASGNHGFPWVLSWSVQHLHFANNAVRIGVLGSI